MGSFAFPSFNVTSQRSVRRSIVSRSHCGRFPCILRFRQTNCGVQDLLSRFSAAALSTWLIRKSCLFPHCTQLFLIPTSIAIHNRACRVFTLSLIQLLSHVHREALLCDIGRKRCVLFSFCRQLFHLIFGQPGAHVLHTVLPSPS